MSILPVLSSVLLLLNTIILYWHNKLAPWLYLLSWLIYLVLNNNDWKVIFSKKEKNWHLVAFVLPPLVFSLYYLDFKLSFIAILANLLLVIGVFYGKNVL